MSIASKAQSLLVDLERPGNFVRDTWDRLQGLPGGRRLFSLLLGQAAPYSASIGAEVVELGVGCATVRMRDRRRVRNHLDCVHAVALVNLAELTGNSALAYSLPDDARFIVAGLSIEYLAKARGTITGRCRCPVPATAARVTYEVPVSLHDEAGHQVARATLRTLVGPKKPRP
jgi:uncharacterized protein (TIGR00369 family)